MKKTILCAALLGLFSASVMASQLSTAPAKPGAASRGPAANKAPPVPEQAQAFAKMQIVQLDTNKDGKLSKAEVSAPGDALFKKTDANSDGSITLAELETILMARISEQQKMATERQAQMQAMIKKATQSAVKKGSDGTKPNATAAVKP